MLFGVSSVDPWTLARAGTALGAISALAALAGALQASFVQPMTVVRGRLATGGTSPASDATYCAND